MQVVYEKITIFEFRPISRYISEMILDEDITAMKSYQLLPLSVTLNDP